MKLDLNNLKLDLNNWNLDLNNLKLTSQDLYMRMCDLRSLLVNIHLYFNECRFIENKFPKNIKTLKFNGFPEYQKRVWIFGSLMIVIISHIHQLTVINNVRIINRLYDYISYHILMNED